MISSKLLRLEDDVIIIDEDLDKLSVQSTDEIVIIDDDDDDDDTIAIPNLAGKTKLNIMVPKDLSLLPPGVHPNHWEYCVQVKVGQDCKYAIIADQDDHDDRHMPTRRQRTASGQCFVCICRGDWKVIGA